jgi:hypothetical protein
MQRKQQYLALIVAGPTSYPLIASIEGITFVMTILLSCIPKQNYSCKSHEVAVHHCFLQPTFSFTGSLLVWQTKDNSQTLTHLDLLVVLHSHPHNKSMVAFEIPTMILIDEWTTCTIELHKSCSELNCAFITCEHPKTLKSTLMCPQVTIVLASP